ncbi:MAG TPA: hypothetical protein VG898_02960, partial [Solirubrobacterales bacterium]|nr:hypothetical protein [Solirubrobacterales bacterium]
ATLQPISAEVLNGFVSVYQGAAEAKAYAGYCANPLAAPLGCTEKSEQEAGKAFAKGEGEKAAKGKSLAAGDPLGVVSFTAQTQ